MLIRLLFAAFLLPALLLLSPAPTAAEPVKTVTTVAVRGNGHFTIVPDTATLTLGVTATAPSLAAAQNDVARNLATLASRLNELGIADKNIRTSHYSVVPLYSDGSHTQMIAGYRVSSSLTVTVDAVARLGEIIDAATAAGANQVQGIAFFRRDEAALKQQALELAIQDAQRKADTIARGLERRILYVQSVTEEGVQLPQDYIRFSQKETLAAATPIFPGPLQVSANISAVFVLE